MDSRRLLLQLACWLLTVEFALCSQGPVFINPNNPTIILQTSTSQGNYVTQTVYGFLDFTTTIGDTVMVFSPQNSEVLHQEPPKPKVDIIENNIIETKPKVINKELEIKPSKTQLSVEKKTSQKVSSIVQVQSNAPPLVSKKVETSSSPTTKVNVVSGKSSANVANSMIMSSKVQVVEAPASQATATHNIITKVEVISGPTKVAKLKPILPSKVDIKSNPKETTINVMSSVVQVKSDDKPAVLIGNNIGEPEYDFLSRQPSEVVEETYKVVNLKPSSKFVLKHRPATDLKKNGNTKRPGAAHPTGLVTKLGGTVVKDGETTVIETSVIGTYISGKYAQVLQSTSRKINPTQSLRILKTAAPSLGKGNKHHRHIEPTPAGALNEDASLPAEALFNAQNSIKSTRKAGVHGGSYKRFKNRHKEPDVNEEDKERDVAPPQPNYKKSQKNRSQSSSRNSKHNTSSHSTPKSRRNRKRKSTTTKPSVHSEESTTSAPGTKRFTGRRNKQTKSSTSTTESNGSYSRKFKPKVQASTVEQVVATSSSLYKFKLNRSPGRWQYKTTAKPRVTIRKQNSSDEATNNSETSETTSSSPQEASQPLTNDVVTPQARSDDVDSLEGSESIASIIDDGSSTENKLDTPAFPVETIKVEISTPPDFTDIYYEIATIKSPYTFQVGNVKNTRYITVTSTFKKSLERTPDPTPTKGAEPLTENILATSSNYAKDNNFLDSSIATLPPIYLASDMETPPLETLTETFSTTQTMLKTHILPVVRFGNDTTSSTLVQTYLVTRLVTATKTLPPMDAYHFIPSKTLNEFNSHLDEAGSELHLELEFGDQNDQFEGQIRKVSLPADLDLANIGSNFDLSDVDKTKLLEGHLRPKKAQPPPKPPMNEVMNQVFNPDQLQQLALYRFLNPAAGQPQVITTSKPVLKLETVFDTYVLPVTQGHNTIQSTISKVKGTFTRTEYEFGTSTIGPTIPQFPPQLPPQFPPQLPPQLPQQLQPQIPQLNPFLPQPQQQFTVTSSPVIQSTTVTQTNSKILKLTFGAKTAHTTVYSTTVVPTFITSYISASVPVAPTAAFPGYFPAPYPGYPYVG